MNDNYGSASASDRPATNDFGTTGGSGGSTGVTGQSSSRMVTGLFRDRESAESAYNSLRTRGYTEQDINVLMSDEARNQHFGSSGGADSELGNKAMEGAGTGAAVGGTVGAVLAAIAAIGTSIALPGLGLVVAGPLAAALMGAGAGGVTGGLLGALVGSGIPEERAREYESGIQQGGIVLGVNPRSDEDAAHVESEFRKARGESVYR